jgi:hypothetical protein
VDFDFGHKYDYLNQVSGEREKERERELKGARESERERGRARASESDRACVQERKRAREGL